MLIGRILLITSILFTGVISRVGADESTALRAEAQRITITRDDWGIAHVHGKTDADAVFGMAYAQAEDDFNRVETNYLTSLGRLAEAEGDKAIYQDLRQRLFIDPADLQAKYRMSPAWLQKLMNAWADGLNYYLATHPNVHPHVISHFEPWMALSFSEGSIGGDIEDVDLGQLRAFYAGGAPAPGPTPPSGDGPIPDPQGSNGIAIAPSNTLNHHALLLINPHTSFYFRSELQMSSDEGLDAYGAVTWGQFFIYQGFNAHAGWMHTSTGANNVDQFAETIVRRDGRLFYKYGTQERPVTVSTIVVPFRTAAGTLTNKTFTVYRTHHGPIVASAKGKWIAEALMYRPVQALEQSYLRTKATNYAQFRKVAELEANSSNNTVFADSTGNIAYMNPQFMPRRNDRFDYTKPVDGSDPATDWQGNTPLDNDPNILNPSTGFIFNTNDWPYRAAGAASPKQSDFPRYMAVVGENARGAHALMLLNGVHDFTLEKLLATAFDTNLPYFRTLIPSLLSAYDGVASSDPLKTKLGGPIAALRSWDYRWSIQSVPTSLAVFWAEALVRAQPATLPHSVEQGTLLAMTPQQKLSALSSAVDKLTADFGTWQTPWGSINRFQRLNDNIEPAFDDAAPSIPVGFTAGTWGSLAAFYAAPAPNTKKRYGRAGNSFVAVVDFGNRVRAVAITAGGQSGDPNSPHFDDQALRYATGNLRPVYFYPDELAKHTVRSYHPGK